jgi:hypothetical protein
LLTTAQSPHDDDEQSHINQTGQKWQQQQEEGGSFKFEKCNLNLPLLRAD